MIAELAALPQAAWRRWRRAHGRRNVNGAGGGGHGQTVEKRTACNNISMGENNGVNQ
jgi:hypothetical protein